MEEESSAARLKPQELVLASKGEEEDGADNVPLVARDPLKQKLMTFIISGVVVYANILRFWVCYPAALTMLGMANGRTSTCLANFQADFLERLSSCHPEASRPCLVGERCL